MCRLGELMSQLYAEICTFDLTFLRFSAIDIKFQNHTTRGENKCCSIYQILYIYTAVGNPRA